MEDRNDIVSRMHDIKLIVCVKLSPIIEDQKFESNVIANAEVRRPSEIPNEPMSHPKDFVGIQNFVPRVNHQLLVMVSKHADIPDTCTDQEIMLK
jgi:hypothetical protein